MAHNFESSDRIFQKAQKEGRDFLFEHEVYDFLKVLGIGSTLPYVLASPKEFSSKQMAALKGENFVLKIVHPRILHKTDVDGVRFATRKEIPKVVRAMLDEVPKNFAKTSAERKEVSREIVGVLITPKVTSSPGFGRELLCGLRATREFGPVLTVGLGGLDTELFAKEFRRGRATISASPGLNGNDQVNAFYEQTVSFLKLTGRSRDHIRTAEDSTLKNLLKRLHEMALHYSALNPSATFWITEFEVNPFLFPDGQATPVDGLLKFKRPEPLPPKPSLAKFKALLRPKNICLIGVSGKSMNVGRIILKNLRDGGFTPDRLKLVRKDGQPVDGVASYKDISKLPNRSDLTILSIPAADVPTSLEEIVLHDKTDSIILITGGMGETSGGKTIERRLKEILAESRKQPSRGPVLVGGNCLGVVSSPGGYDTLFIPESRMPRNRDLPMGKNVAFVSQSGAFMISRMNRMGGFVPRYAVSTGNQIDVGTADFLEYLITDDEVKTFGCYIEGFRDLEGIRFAQAAQEAVRQGKEVIVYKAGRTVAGKKAAGGHTAAIAGDWDVAREILTNAGCIFATSFEEWSDLLMLSSLLAGKSVGTGRVAAISNAGAETVATADQTGSGRESLELAVLAPSTIDRVQRILARHKLSELQEVRNPMDMTPMASDRAHFEVLQAFHSDPNVDLLVHACLPLTATIQAIQPDHPESYSKLLISAPRSEFTKPLVAVVDAGELYDPLVGAMFKAGIPVFRSIDRALMMLAKWAIHHRTFTKR